MKTVRITSAVVLGLILLLSLGVMSTAAAGPTDANPVGAPFIDNQTHTVPGNSWMWVRFLYSGTDTVDHPITTIRLVNGNRAGLGFEVWSPERLLNWWDNKPVGKGTFAPVNCDTGQLAGDGGCHANDLSWSGAFGASGPYYVRVVNEGAMDAPVMLTIQGDGVTLMPQAMPLPGTVSQAPALGAKSVNMDDPGRSMIIDGKPVRVPANSAIWYQFDYAGTDAVDRPVTTITLWNGYKSGVSFEVWSQDRLNQWWDNKPVGKGTSSPVMCDTGVLSGAGDCNSNNLTWSGAFRATGKYYVRVVNDNAFEAMAQLTIH